MATKTASVRARIEPKLKLDAEFVLHELGITPADAIRLLYKAIAREHAWPIDLKIPNSTTKQTFSNTDQGRGLNRADDLPDLFEKLDI